MNKKNIVLFSIMSLWSAGIASIDTQLPFATYTPPPKPTPRATIEGPTGTKESTIKTGPVAFGGNNALYIGTSEENKAETSLVRVLLKRTNGKWELDPQTIANKETYLNKLPDAEQKGRANSTAPYNCIVTNIALISAPGNTDATSTQLHPVVSVSPTKSAAKIFLIQDPLTNTTFKQGDVVYANEEALVIIPVSTAPVVATATTVGSINALAATKKDFNLTAVNMRGITNCPLIFAAVANGKTWDDAASTTRGISLLGCLLQTDLTYTLTPFNATNFTNQTHQNSSAAALITKSVISDIASTANPTFDTGATVDLWWDNDLERLFIALSGLTPEATKKATGLVVGRIDTTNKKLELNPAFFPAALPDDKTHIIGTKNPNQINLYKVRTMHSSTGNVYVIVNGGIKDGEDLAKVWLFALPIVTGNDNATRGTLAKKADHKTAATTAADLMSVNRTNWLTEPIDQAKIILDDKSTIVGENPLLLVTQSSADADQKYAANFTISDENGKDFATGFILNTNSTIKSGSFFGKETEIGQGIHLTGIELPVKTNLSGNITVDANEPLPAQTTLSGVAFNRLVSSTDPSTIAGILKIDGPSLKNDGTPITLGTSFTFASITPAPYAIPQGPTLNADSIYLLKAGDNVKAIKVPAGESLEIDADSTYYLMGGCAIGDGSIFPNDISFTTGSTSLNFTVGDNPLSSTGRIFAKNITLGDVRTYATWMNSTAGATITLGDKIDITSDITRTSSPITLNGSSKLTKDSIIAKGSLQTPGAATKDVSFREFQVVGDTIYAALAEQRKEGASADAGIFASTAIFESNGRIRRWTGWKHVMGASNAVYNFGLDQETNNFWYLTTENGLTGDPNKVKVTQWGKGDTDGSIHEKSPLSSVLDKEFAPTGGIISLTDFNDTTPGFKQSSSGYEWPYFSMMVATGHGMIALIQTGSQVSGVFDATKKFTTKTTAASTQSDATAATSKEPSTDTNNVFIFKGEHRRLSTDPQSPGEDLADIGVITCAEFSRIAEKDKGWLFVGGNGGVAVLSRSSEDVPPVDMGKGFDGGNKTGLSQLTAEGFPGSTDWQFLRLTIKDTDGKTDINPFPNVRKLMAIGKWLYILTPQYLHRIEMKQDYFKNGDLVSSNYKSFKIQDLITTLTSPYDELLECIPVNITKDSDVTFLFGTTKGLYTTTISNAATITASTEIKALNNTKLGPALKFDFIGNAATTPIPTTAVPAPAPSTADGNLSVVALDEKETNLCVYRFDVQGETISAITHLFKDAAALTPYFYKIGGIGPKTLETAGPIDLYNLTNHFGNQMVTNIGSMPDPSNFLKTDAIDLKLQGVTALKSARVGSVIRDSGSGALYIPGEFGIRVNE